MADARAPAPATRVSLAAIALGLAGVTVAVALGVGLVAGVATAFLALVTGALLGSILLVWHSIRTLAGDADVEPGLDLAASRTRPADLDLFEEKQRALRALKDIEQENALGKIDDKDFKKLEAEYRAMAKEAIRALDESVAPWREKAEALVRAHLEKRAAARKKAPADDAETEEDVACPKCKTKNDADAAFCKKCGTKLTSES